MMSKLFWFLYKPKDERESLIMNTALNRSFSLLVILTLLTVVFLDIFYELLLPYPSEIIMLFGKIWLLIILAISYFAGYLKLRKEDITFEHVYPKKISFFGILVICLVLYVVYLIYAWVFVQYAFITVLIYGLTVNLILILTAYKISESLPKLWRTILSIIFPIFVLAFFMLKKRHIALKLLAALLVYFLLINLVAGSMILILRFKTSPYYIETDYFEPELKKCSIEYINKRYKNYKEYDYIIFDANRIGQIISVAQNEFEVQTADGIVIITRNNIIGKVIHMAGVNAGISECE